MVSKVVSPCNSSAKLPSLGYFRLSPKSQFDNFQRHNNGHVAACGTHGKCLAMSLRFEHGPFLNNILNKIKFRSKRQKEDKNNLALQGIEPRTSHMLSERCTYCATNHVVLCDTEVDSISLTE